MLKNLSRQKFYDRSQLLRLEGKHTAQTAHCAVLQPKSFPYVVISIFSMVLVCIDYYHQQMTEDLELQSQRSL